MSRRKCGWAPGGLQRQMWCARRTSRGTLVLIHRYAKQPTCVCVDFGSAGRTLGAAVTLTN